MLNDRVSTTVNQHAREFATAKPFRHVVIDDFFAPSVADELLAQFPAFETGNARTENGTLGNKSTVEKIRDLGPSYAALDDAIQSDEFLETMGRITGIDKLLYDPWYFGGGTHHNRHGQDLDPHVDFNRHPSQRWHRRLNLIVYLNHEWLDAWGGSLELHSDPRSADDQVSLVTPLFNRCVIFETTEHSWHGFSRIDLPENKRDLARRSVALYFYTEDRPAEELADTHSTIYVDRPLPDRFRAGHTLSDIDVANLQELLTRRDQHNQRLYRELTEREARVERAEAALFAGRLGRLRYFLERTRNALRR